VALASALIAPGFASAATITVCPAGCDAATVQGGVGLANPSDVVTVSADVYVEQVEISEPITLRGAGAGTVIRSPIGPVSKFTTNLLAPDNAPAVLVRDNANATVEDMTIDGAARGGPTCTLQFAGLAFYRSGGVGRNLTITDFRHAPLDGCQVGTGIFVFNDDAAPPSRTLTLTGNTLSGYQKTGISVTSTDLTMDLDDNTVTGAGAQTEISQNGIVVSGSVVPFGSPPGTLSSGALPTGTISDTTVTGHLCNQASCGPDPLTQSQSSGVSLIDADVTLTANTVAENDNGLRLRATRPARAGSMTATGNNVSNNRYAGLYATAGTATLTSNAITGPGNVGVLAGAFLQGADQFTPTVTLEANTLSNLIRGIRTFRNAAGSASPVVAGAKNRIVGNTIAGADNASGSGSLDLQSNWWGCNGGPGAAGCDGTSGGVDADPWLVLGATATPSTITAGGATSAINASARTNSDRTTLTGPFFAPVDTVFATTIGTISPTTTPLAGGDASSILTSGPTTGAGTVFATVDNATATATLTVVARGSDAQPQPPSALPAPTPVSRDASAPVVRLVGIRGRQGCTRRGFVVRIRVSDDSAVRSVVRLDRRRVRNTAARSFRVRVPRALRGGRHALVVVTTDAAGNRLRKTIRFSRCGAQRAPRLTG
jgi:hypothetical protein